LGDLPLDSAFLSPGACSLALLALFDAREPLPLALLRSAFSLIGEPLAPIGHVLTVVRKTIAIVRDSIALICHPLPLGQRPLAVADRLLTFRKPVRSLLLQSVALAIKPSCATLDFLRAPRDRSTPSLVALLYPPGAQPLQAGAVGLQSR
jgi:hypothetical protein